MAARGGSRVSVGRASGPPWAKDSLTSAFTLREKDIAVPFGEVLDTPEIAWPHSSVQNL